MFFKRCQRCSKLLFRSKKIIGENHFCEVCYGSILDEKKMSDKINAYEIKKIYEIDEKRKLQEKSRLKAENAKKLLIKELEQTKLDEKRKFEKALLKRQEEILRSKMAISYFQKQEKRANTQRKRDGYFSEDEIKNNNKLLYLEADVKRVKVIEWIDGKMRVVLNKSREVRRTHAGGYSQEKFQKFVRHKKEKTFEWITNLLDRPGVLRLPYDKIMVVSNDDTLKDKIYSHIQKINNS